MKWKNRLKTVLAEPSKIEKTGKSLEMVLTKADKTQPIVVSSVIVSAKLRHSSENSINSGNPPNCSNCTLRMIFIQNESIWFCPFGCEKRPIIKEQ